MLQPHLPTSPYRGRDGRTERNAFPGQVPQESPPEVGEQDAVRHHRHLPFPLRLKQGNQVSIKKPLRPPPHSLFIFAPSPRHPAAPKRPPLPRPKIPLLQLRHYDDIHHVLVLILVLGIAKGEGGFEGAGERGREDVGQRGAGGREVVGEMASLRHAVDGKGGVAGAGVEAGKIVSGLGVADEVEFHVTGGWLVGWSGGGDFGGLSLVVRDADPGLVRFGV